jgi:hypothetical protein
MRESARERESEWARGRGRGRGERERESARASERASERARELAGGGREWEGRGGGRRDHHDEWLIENTDPAVFVCP